MNTWKVRVYESAEKQYNVVIHADRLWVQEDTGFLTFSRKTGKTNVMGGELSETVAVFPHFVYCKLIVSEEP